MVFRFYGNIIAYGFLLAVLSATILGFKPGVNQYRGIPHQGMAGFHDPRFQHNPFFPLPAIQMQILHEQMGHYNQRKKGAEH